MKSKVIVITGATDRVGAAAARRLACDGHHVVLVGRSTDKTAALAQDLARYGRGRGIDTAAFHPGNIASDYAREATSSLRRLHHIWTRHPWAVTPKHGADTLVFLAEGRPEVDFPSGQYFVRGKVAKPNRQAYDRMLAFELWNRSETMIDDGATSDRDHRRSVTAHSRHIRRVLWWPSRTIDESVTFR